MTRKIVFVISLYVCGFCSCAALAAALGGANQHSVLFLAVAISQAQLAYAHRKH